MDSLPARSRRSIAAILVASSAGTILEWYDFIIYPVAGTLASLGGFSVGFLMRAHSDTLAGP